MPRYIASSLGLGLGGVAYNLICVLYTRVAYPAEPLNWTHLVTEPIHWRRMVFTTLVSIPMFWFMGRGKNKQAKPLA